MKQLMMNVMIGCLIATGFSQNQKTEKSKNDTPQKCPTVEKIQVEKNNSNDIQWSNVKNNDLPPGKIAFTRDAEKANQKSKYHSAANAKPKQVLNTDRPNNFGQDKEQIYSKTKNRKKLGRVKGYAPREEMKKIDVHPPVSEEVLIQALGNPKPIQKQSN